MATDKTQGLPHVAAATTAEIFGAALAKHVQKRLASLTRSRDACEAELKIVSDVPGFEPRVKYFSRPHYHALLFNCFFPDRKKHSTGDS